MSRSTANSSGALAAGSTTTIQSNKGTVNSIQAFTDGTNDVTVSVYDNTAASGKLLAKLVVLGASKYGHVVFDCAVRADTALTVEVTGTGGTAIVHTGAA